MIKVEAITVVTEIRVNMVVSYKGRIKIITRKRGIIRQPEILTSKPLKRAILPTRHAGNVARTTLGNADKGLQCVTSAVRRGTFPKDAMLRPQMITGITRIKKHISDPYRL